MDSTEHQNLTDVIKGVHQKLREAVNSSCDPDKVWADHLKDYELRKKYSACMLKLATEFWSEKESRIAWTYKTCLDYFFGGGLQHSLIRQIEKEKRKRQWVNKGESLFENVDTVPHNYEKLNRKLKLLDVGSCYNPFSKFNEFECVAIDLTPATKDVLQFDFLSVEIIPKGDEDSSNSTSSIFLEENFDIVVLSLVLEYLPSAKQRTIFCYKSWQLLKENGLCIIITPDSKSVNYNAQMIKSWKLALEHLGFLRVKYEKLQHIHCMAFRKLNTKGKICDYESVISIAELLYIPQDFRAPSEKKETEFIRTEEDNLEISILFTQLPNELAF